MSYRSHSADNFLRKFYFLFIFIFFKKGKVENIYLSIWSLSSDDNDLFHAAYLQIFGTLLYADQVLRLFASVCLC